jgi:putative FmdB family regulatory protein
MPAFEFKCEQCECVFERMIKVSQRNLNQACPQCGGVSKREVSKANFTVMGFNAENGYSRNH